MNNKYLLFILASIGLIYLKSSITKILSGVFVSTLGSTLAKFAPKNPYPPVQSFLQDIAIPNATTFGFLTMWGEFLVALALVVSTCYLFFYTKKRSSFMLLLLIAGSGGGLFLNAIFWLATGYTSSSGDTLNMLMFFIEATGLVFGFKLLKDRKLS